jgi:hypothetical protein
MISVMCGLQMTNARRCERSRHLSGKSVQFPSYRVARDASKVPKSPAPKSEVCKPDQSDRYRPDPTRKIIRFFFAAKRGFLFASRLGKRGVRVVTNVGRDAMDASRVDDERHGGGRRNRVVLALRCRR